MTKEQTTTVKLTEFERELLRIYRQLNEVGQQKVAEYAKDLSKLPEYTGQVKNGGSDSVQEVM